MHVDYNVNIILSHNIVAMDEIAVWNNMVSETAVEAIGAKDISMKSTGHEKVCVSVCLAAKLDETKLKSFIVFVCCEKRVEIIT